jgi:hypothetical protein
MVWEELLGLLIIQGRVDNHIITLVPVDGSYDLGENGKVKWLGIGSKTR